MVRGFCLTGDTSGSWSGLQKMCTALSRVSERAVQPLDPDTYVQGSQGGRENTHYARTDGVSGFCLLDV